MNYSNCYNIEVSRTSYKPVALIFHHYPTQSILDKVRAKETTIVENTRIINKLKKKLLNHVIKKEKELGIQNLEENYLIKLESRIERIKTSVSSEEEFSIFNETIISWNENVKQIENTFDKSFEYFNLLKEIRNKLRFLEYDESTTESEICNKAICVGIIPEHLIDILNEISENRIIPDINTDEYVKLSEYFGENFQKDWGKLDKNFYSEIDFLPYYILPSSTIFNIQRIIALHYNYRIEHQYLWAYLNLDDIDEKLFLISKLYYNLYDDNTGFTQSTVMDFFEKLGFSHNDILKRAFNIDNKIKDIQNDYEAGRIDNTERDLKISAISKTNYSLDDFNKLQPLNSLIVAYLKYQCLTFETLSEKNFKIGQWPDENPYFSMKPNIEGSSIPFLELNSKDNIKYTNVNQNRTFCNFGHFERNEIHWVGLPKIVEYIKNNRIINLTTSRFTRDYIISTINRFFYNIETVDQLNTITHYPTTDDELASLDEQNRIFYLYLYGNMMIDIPDELNYQLGCRNIIEIKLSLEQYISKTNIEPFNLRDILNRIILNNDMPFVRLYDDQRSENIYRIYKPSFGIGSYDKISIDQLEKWIHRENFSLNLGKLTKIHEPKKCLTFKVRLCNQQISQVVKEIVTKTLTSSNDGIKRYNIYYNDGIFEENVEEYLLSEDNKFVFEHTPIFIDIYFYEIQGSIEIKVIFQPAGFSENLFYKLFIDKINVFINSIRKENPYFIYLNTFDAKQLLNRTTDYSNQTIINMSSILEYSYTSKFHLTYDYLRRVLSIFTPFFTIIEPTYTPETSVEFLLDGINWKKNAYILKCNIDDGTYNIVYNDGVDRIEVDRIKPHLIKQVGEKSKNYYINFRYRRVSNYIKETPIIEILKKNLDWGLSIDQIKDKILKLYDISSDEIDELNKRVNDASDNIKKQNDKRAELNGIDIKLYLEPEEDEFNYKKYKIEMEHYRNGYDFSCICDLLDLIFKIYYTLYDKNDIHFIDQTFNIDTSAATYEKRQQETEFLEQQTKLEELNFLADFGFDLEDDMEMADTEQSNELIEKPKKEQIVNQEILDFDYEMIGNSNNLILEKLYKSDRKLFYWESDDKKQKYSIACMGTKRYPKVVGPERFKYIYEKYRYALGLTYMGNKNIEGNPEILVDEEYCEPDKPISAANKCVSIRYGSQDEPMQWSNYYMCPKIWCIRDKIPLHPRDLIDGENKNKELGCAKFESKGDISVAEIKSIYKNIKEYQKQEYIIWRVCKNCDEDILNHNIKCPECRCGPLDITNTNMIPTKSTSLYILPKDSNFIYPGFVNPDKHPNKIPAVCCFSNPNSRLDKKFLISSEKTNYNTQAYIQSFGKELQPGRFGQLPLAFGGFMDLDIEYFSSTSIRCESNSKNYYYRYGVLSTPSENCLNILAFYLLLTDISVNSDVNTLTKITELLLHNIVKRITLEQLSKYPMIEYAFRSGDISSLQNYIEFLISDDPKPDFTLLQILNQSMNWLGNMEGILKNKGEDDEIIDIGVNIFILSTNDDGKLVIEIPRGFVQPYELGKKTQSILLFRNKNIDNMLEPIVYTNKSCDKQSGESNKKINKFFDHDNPIITKIFNEILPHINIEDKANAIFNNTDNKYLNITEFHDKNFDRFLDNSEIISKLGYTIQNVVLNINNLVVGFIVADVFIPVFPTSYNSKLDDFIKLNYLDMLSSDLPSFKTVIDILNSLISLDAREFSYLTPIKFIISNIQDENLFTAYYISCGIIIPFEPVKTIGNQLLPTLHIDFYKIETAIFEYNKKQKFTPRLSLQDISKLPKVNFEYDYVIDADNILKGIVVFSLEFNIGNTFIQMNEQYWSLELPDNIYIGNIPKYDIETTLQNYTNLYKSLNGIIPSRIIGVTMIEDTKAIDKLLIETGDYIPVRIDTHIYKKYKHYKYRYLIHRIQEVEMEIHQDDDIYNYEKYHTDGRIDFIMSLNYNKYSYERFRFELSRLLSLSDSNNRSNGRVVPKKEITELINNNKLGLQEKRSSLSKMIINLVKNNIVYKSVDISKIGKGQTYVEQTCTVHKTKNQCSTDPFCNWVDETNGLTLDEFVDTNKQKILEIIKSFGTNEIAKTKYLNNIRKYLQKNGHNWDDTNIDNNINNKLNIDYYRKGNCRLLLLNDENVDFVHSKYIRKLVDEILRNPIRRREILDNSIKIVDTRLSYNVYPNEVFYTEKDIKNNTNELKTLYQQNRRSRLRVFNHFNKNSSQYFDKIEVIENNQYIEQKLRDNSYLLYNVTGIIPFSIIIESQVLSPGDEHKIHDIIILEDQQAILDIIRLNTPLTSHSINRISRDILFQVIPKDELIDE
jgi:hypothetical protein